MSFILRFRRPLLLALLTVATIDGCSGEVNSGGWTVHSLTDAQHERQDELLSEIRWDISTHDLLAGKPAADYKELLSLADRTKSDDKETSYAYNVLAGGGGDNEGVFVSSVNFCTSRSWLAVSSFCFTMFSAEALPSKNAAGNDAGEDMWPSVSRRHLIASTDWFLSWIAPQSYVFQPLGRRSDPRLWQVVDRMHKPSHTATNRLPFQGVTLRPFQSLTVQRDWELS